MATILTGVATLKKHYNNLWKGLPEDHMITLGRFCDIKMYGIYDDVVDQIISSANSQWANMQIFNILISLIKNDFQLLGLSFLIERLTTGGLLISECPNIESFRNGQL